MKDKCEWVNTSTADERIYETNCGESFMLNEGTPKENHIVYCPFCGRKIKEKI